MFLRIFTILPFLVSSSLAQIFADFQVQIGGVESEFTVQLLYEDAPLAVTNFIYLAGKGDDILETRAGVPAITSPLHPAQPYITRTIGTEVDPASDSLKLPLTVTRVEATVATETTEATPAMYVIRQNQTQIGAVEEFATGGFHRDITGRDWIRLSQVSASPLRYRITIRYPRPWFDPNFQIVRDAPMYQALRIRRVETGKRFFAGGVTRDRDDFFEHPGYRFQDEMLAYDTFSGEAYLPARFNSPYVLAMDSPGANQNGNRFFITSAADSSWNGRYTPFGVVVGLLGQNVVNSITDIPTDFSMVPQLEMFILNIKIRFVGESAATFFPSYHAGFLPGAIEPIGAGFERVDGVFSLVNSLKPSSSVFTYVSRDLQTYFGAGSFGYQSPSATEPLLTDYTLNSQFDRKLFVKSYAVPIPSWPSEEMDLSGTQLRFNITSENDIGFLTLNFAADGLGGTYSMNVRFEQELAGGTSEFVVSQRSGTFSATYRSDGGPYEGRFIFTGDTADQLRINELIMNFDATRADRNPQISRTQKIRRFQAWKVIPVDGGTDLRFPSYSGIFGPLR